MAGRRSWTRVLGMAAAISLLAGACGDDDEDSTTPTTGAIGGEAEAEQAPAEDEGEGGTTITAVDHAFEDVPAEIPGGAFAFTFTNEGEVDHEIVFVEVGDTELEQFFADFAPVIVEGGAFPDYAEDLVGANEAAPGESVDLVFTIPEGTYAMFCALTGTPEDPEGEGPPHFEQGMAQVVTVGAAEGETELPEADGTITASDYTFDADLSGGDTVINFVNEGPDQVHFAGFDVYPEGTTPEQAEEGFAALLALEEGQEPPEGTVFGEEIGFSGIAGEGEGIQFAFEGFESGRTYLFYCFIQDRTGGPPHAIANQMYKAFTVQ